MMRFSYQDRFKPEKIILLILLVLFVSTDALAGGRNVRGSRTDNGFHRSSVLTGPQGRTMTRNSEGSWDSQTETWNRSVTTTGPGGQSVQHNRTAIRTDDGYVRNSTVTGPDGNTATREAEGHWDPETGTWSKSVVIKGSEE